MKTKEYELPMKNEFIYMSYLMEHGENVVHAWGNLQFLLLENDLITEEEAKKIDQLIIHHDETKIISEEFWAYAHFFCGVPESDIDFKAAWKHHLEHNVHHHQTLRYYKGDDWKCYAVEMICDWSAMGVEMGDTAYLYYENNKDKIILPVEYLAFVLKVLALIKDRDTLLTSKNEGYDKK